MPTYFGFSTINALKSNAIKSSTDSAFVPGAINGVPKPRTTRKFRLTDEELIIRDFTNALLIKQGEKPGNPTYGTTIWNLVFEPSNSDTQAAIEEEIRRVASLDPRLNIESLLVYMSDDTVLLQLEVSYNPGGGGQTLSLTMSKSSGTITQS
jgi:phage baseplate assembly protein W